VRNISAIRGESVQECEPAGKKFGFENGIAMTEHVNQSCPEGTRSCAGRPPVILIVDDDPVARILAAKSLKKAGFAVAEASNGKQALDIFEVEKPAIVLLDVVMPEMDGFETCRTLREKSVGDPSLAIVMVTGADDLESINRAYDAGATDFIAKPINWLILTQRVRYILRAGLTLAELEKSKALLASAQRIAHLGSWELDLETGSLLCSREMFEIFGLGPTRADLHYDDLLEHVTAEYLNTLKSMVNQARFLGKPFKMEHAITRTDGVERFVFQQVEVVSDKSSGRIQRLVGIVQDITARRRAELFEADRNRVMELIIRNHPLPEILSEIAELVKRQKPQMGCAVFLFEDDRLNLGGSSGVADAFLDTAASNPVGPKGNSASAAAYYAQTMMACDTETSPLWEGQRSLALDNGIRADCSVPFFSGLGTVLGTLTLVSPKVFHPSQDELKLFDAVCKLAAVAIEQRQLSEQLAHQARHDALTGLPNRASLKDLRQRVASRSTQNEQVAVMFIDLDRFKQVNDSLGHSTGDLLLKKVAARLKKCTRGHDTLVRMGGDEFMIILDRIDNREVAGRAATRVLDLLKKPFMINDQEIHIGASIGLSVLPEDGQDLEILQQNADVAMYRAKNQGGNQFQFYVPEMNTLLLKRLEIENELRKALERNELELHYQPQFKMGDKRICGVEALIRWNHPELGRIAPIQFIPVAEESGLIIRIGNWVLTGACRQNAEWQERGYPPFPVAVKVSSVELMSPHFVETVEMALRQVNLAPQWLQLEIAETVLLENRDETIERLEEIRKLGVSIAVDDFGTGYSSMSYLQRLPIDCLKIDRTFIKEIEGAEDLSLRSRALVQAIVSLAQNLGLRVVAEGIESHSQQALLSSIGCEIGQGYLFEEPITAGEVDLLCRKMDPSLLDS
jgi:diguanylate cyclase (GGDEF)-like protein/PAS domain S-box-containing protein